MDQAVPIALPQEFDDLAIAKLTGHAMLHRPAAQIASMDARFQYMFTVVAGVH